MFNCFLDGNLKLNLLWRFNFIDVVNSIKYIFYDIFYGILLFFDIDYNDGNESYICIVLIDFNNKIKVMFVSRMFNVQKIDYGQLLNFVNVCLEDLCLLIEICL